MQLIPINANDPEDVLVLPDGSLLTGVAGGRILHITNEQDIEVIADTRGRPLGLELLSDRTVLICDSTQGLLKLDLDSRTLETLIPKGEHALSFCNNASIASDGRIFFSDSSQRHGFAQASTDVLDSIPTGRLLCRHPDGRVEVLLDKLLFANGVVLAPDESFVLVAETGGMCITRLWLTGAKAGQRDHFVTAMVGLPDNLSVGSDGLVWVGLVAPNNKKLQQLLAAPKWLRLILARIPRKLLGEVPYHCRVVAYDFDGNLIHDVSGDAKIFEQTTSVREHNGSLYIGSIHSNAILKMYVGQ